MEKIVEINDYDDIYGRLNVSGFEVVTTEQRIRLFIDNRQLSCEQWGYFWCNDHPQDFVGAELYGVTLTDTALSETRMKANELDQSAIELGVMFVNLETNKGTLQFVAYNDHNGFYGHEATVQCSQLHHKETL